MDISHFIYLSVDIWAIMNNIALNISIQVSVWTYISSSYMCIPRSGIAGSYENSVQLFESESGSVLSNSLQPHGLGSPWNSQGQNTGVDSLSPLQGIFPTQGSNPGLPHCRQILYQLSQKGNPRILQCVAYPFSSGSS